MDAELGRETHARIRQTQALMYDLEIQGVPQLLTELRNRSGAALPA